MVKKGATSIWERWNSNTAKPGMNTMSHLGFVSIDQWFYEHLAGIKPIAGFPGFKHFKIEPKPIPDLEFVKANLETPYGMIKVKSENIDDTFKLNLTVPANSKANVYLPLLQQTILKINGNSYYIDQQINAEIQGIRYVDKTNEQLIVEVGSGTYVFEVK
jgi:alpha-L-rhamnosidase